MKKSERLELLAMNEENGIKAWSYHFQSRRAERDEFFLEILPKLRTQTDITENKNGSFLFVVEPFGKCDLYPKSNKILIRKENKWKRNGLQFLVKKLNLKLG